MGNGAAMIANFVNHYNFMIIPGLNAGNFDGVEAVALTDKAEVDAMLGGGFDVNGEIIGKCSWGFLYAANCANMMRRDSNNDNVDNEKAFMERCFNEVELGMRSDQDYKKARMEVDF